MINQHWESFNMAVLQVPGQFWWWFLRFLLFLTNYVHWNFSKIFVFNQYSILLHQDSLSRWPGPGLTRCGNEPSGFDLEPTRLTQDTTLETQGEFHRKTVKSRTQVVFIFKKNMELMECNSWNLDICVVEFIYNSNVVILYIVMHAFYISTTSISSLTLNSAKK